MHTIVLGAGALGSIMAGALAKAGNEVTLLARGERAELIDRRGVTLTGIADYTVPVRVARDPGEVHTCDLLVVAVKTYDTEAALEGVRHVKAGSAFSVQNGVVKNEQLIQVFGQDVVLGAAAGIAGEVMSDGSVAFTGSGALRIGELTGGSSERVAGMVRMFEAAGIPCSAGETIQTTEWSKFVAWASLAPLALLTRFPTHLLLTDPDICRLHVKLAREVARIADGLGIELDDSIGLAPAAKLASLPLDEAIEHQQGVGRAMEARGATNHRLSVLQDFERGRRLEVEETLGDLVRKAEPLGLEAPLVETSYRLMAALSRSVTGSRQP